MHDFMDPNGKYQPKPGELKNYDLHNLQQQEESPLKKTEKGRANRFDQIASNLEKKLIRNMGYIDDPKNIVRNKKKEDSNYYSKKDGFIFDGD